MAYTVILQSLMLDVPAVVRSEPTDCVNVAESSASINQSINRYI